MKVNIVMLASGRQRLTEQALITLFKNTPEELYNLTIVQDGLLQPSYITGKGRDLSSLNVDPRVGVTSRLRNLGVYWSEKQFGRGDYLYLRDNDVYFCPKWLEILLGLHETIQAEHISHHVLVGGWNHPYHLANSTQLMPDYSIKNRMGFFEVRQHDAVAGASQLMRWSTWDQYGPLSDSGAHGVGQSEDTLFCSNIVKDGGFVGKVYPHVVLNTGVVNSL